MKIRVYHAYYGCETGCCGHYFEVEGKGEQFEFGHCYDDDLKGWAREQIEAVIKERWPECLDSIDWDSLNIDDAVTSEGCTF